MSFGYLLGSYHQLNVDDRFLNHTLSVTFLASMVIDLLYGQSFPATILAVVSWNTLVVLAHLEYVSFDGSSGA
jgi:hypothetical protein